MLRTMTMVTLTALALGGGAGCKDEPNPCDSTSYYSGSSCLPKMDATIPATEDAAPPLAAEAGAPSLDADQGEASGAGASLLGAPCSDSVTHAECQGPDTDYCAVQPGKAGYCTKSGCVTDGDCPPNWTCFDLSKMGVMGYPAMCTKPTS
jgi:hypothetical protein